MEAATAGVWWVATAVTDSGGRRPWLTAAPAVGGGDGLQPRHPWGARSPEGTGSGPSTASGGRPLDADGRLRR